MSEAIDRYRALIASLGEQISAKQDEIDALEDQKFIALAALSEDDRRVLAPRINALGSSIFWSRHLDMNPLRPIAEDHPLWPEYAALTNLVEVEAV